MSLGEDREQADQLISNPKATAPTQRSPSARYKVESVCR